MLIPPTIDFSKIYPIEQGIFFVKPAFELFEGHDYDRDIINMVSEIHNEKLIIYDAQKDPIFYPNFEKLEDNIHAILIKNVSSKSDFSEYFNAISEGLFDEKIGYRKKYQFYFIGQITSGIEDEHFILRLFSGSFRARMITIFL